MIRQTIPMRLKLVMDEETADLILNEKLEKLGERSFREVFTGSLREVREKIGETAPELVFLTGGVSKMQQIRQLVREAFPDSVVITGAEPEFAVARGLALCGRIDEDIRQNSFHRAYLLYGEEAYLRNQKRDALLAALVPAGDVMNFARFEGKGIDEHEIISLAETLPFLAERRVILVEDSGFFKCSFICC